jgi:hypothetical protein
MIHSQATVPSTSNIIAFPMHRARRRPIDPLNVVTWLAIVASVATFWATVGATIIYVVGESVEHFTPEDSQP